MKSLIRIISIVAIAAMAVSAFAALSDQYAQFGKGPASFLMTKEEQAEWKNITSDADAQAFIDLFWARRDPTPGTLRNEFREDFEQRVKYADEKFTFRAQPGSMTDRGKTLILLGGPTAPIRQFRTQAATTADPGERADLSRDAANAGRQLWTYDPTKTPVPIGLPANIMFVEANGDWRLTRESPPEVTRNLGLPTDFNMIFDHVRSAVITQPNITAAQIAELKASAGKPTTTTTTTTTSTTTTRSAPPSATPLKTAALQAAIDAQKGGKSTLGANTMLGYAQFVSPMGDYFVPVDLVIGKAANLTADGGDTIFGLVEDSTGKVVSTFEEPAKPFVSNGDVVVDRTLDLGTAAAGKYNVVVGLAKAGQPVAVTSQTIDIAPIAKEASGTSGLIITNDAHELAEAAPVKAPFAFGKLKIVPKTTVGNKDELTYFIEVHNPGLDTASNMPKMQAKVEFSGGKLTQPITAPLSDIPAMPLSGTPGPGQYAIISAIPLSQMPGGPLPPGEYKLKVKLIDTITKQTYNVEQSFKVTG